MTSTHLPIYGGVSTRAERRLETAETPGVSFRDPPRIDEAARALELEMASALVGARELPVPLPAFDLTLLGAAPTQSGVELQLGPDDAVLAIHLSWHAPTGEPRVDVRPLQPEAERWSRAVEIMQARLRIAVTKERYDRAMVAARKLRRLPAQVPLGFFRQLVAGVSPPQGLVRTGFRCNQDCGMCWQDRTWGTYPPEQILTWIEDLRSAGAEHLIVSGGEPMLDPQLDAYGGRAKELGFRSIILETNAIQASKPGGAARVVDAGFTGAFVSLHSGDAKTSDAITRAPGTHARTVRGILALLEAGLPVTLNAVMTAQGLSQLDQLPDFISREFGRSALLRGLTLSYPTTPFDATLEGEIAPEPQELRRVLRRTIDRSMALGLDLSGLDGPCGPALCAFGADARVLRPERRSPVDFRLKLPECRGCTVADYCLGVRHADAERFGARAVAPLREVPTGWTVVEAGAGAT